MGSEYDTGKIRALARAIAGISDQVSDVDSDTLKPIGNEMPANFCGEAANALSASVENLRTDVRTLSAELRGISRSLYDLADRLDEADAAASALIKSR
ncbi:MAG: WXG100 family type VII secretion target [Oscillospiraceae bacterium]|nr:WXG100 family type VII secretion target [Oscillospiraceae bacterium]